jgi:two-component system KDP operon response regulator KdpE
MSVVLVVEDNALVTDAMRVLLESCGHEVVSAETVEEAVTRVEEHDPALVLLDLSLPDGHGLDALERYVAPGRRQPITVALTGHDDPDLRERCLRAGCRDVLLKPVPARKLMAMVNDWVGEAIERRSE